MLAAASSARGFAQRAAAIDLLEVHVFDRLAATGAPLEAAELRARLERANARVVERLRARIRGGRFTPAGLRRAFARCASAGPGFDALDTLVGGLLDAGEPEVGQGALEPEMVPYQPAPARVILELARRVGPEDEFMDVGSGLGRVAILVALLTGARARGLEVEPAFCRYAERSARGIGAAGVSFEAGDARRAALNGNVFFLFTPFRGAMLAEVLGRLQALKRPLRVLTHGPCTAEVARVGWLRQTGEGELAEFQS